MARIDGLRVCLRLVGSADAEYIHRLRSDPRYNEHLSAVTGGVAEQRAWIESYKSREADGSEYYYVIERRDNETPCGVVRLYNIAGGCFTWGSWILDQNKPFMAALECAVLVYRAGFERLDCARSVFEVLCDNAHTLSFHQRFGAIETGRDDANIYFEYPKEQFEADLPRHTAMIERGSAKA